MEHASDYRHILNRELSRRIDANPRYSMRAFAKALDLDPAILSKVLSRKRILSVQSSFHIAEALSLTPTDRSIFLKSVVDEQSNLSAKRSEKKLGISGATAAGAPTTLDIDLFRAIGDWYHIAILELSQTKDFVSDARWIAKALGISVTEAKLAIERLLNLNLLTRKDDRLVKTDENLSTTNKNISTPALRKFQRQILEKAIFSLENDPLETRNMTGVTMAIDPERLVHAKKMILDFMGNLMEFLEGGEKKQVFQLAVSLYPLQQKNSDHPTQEEK